jgi:hypothetical protein
MTRHDLICRTVGFMLEDIELMRKKNSDYSPEDDALQNFRDFGAEGIVVRLGDKYHRAKTWAKRGSLVVSGEGIMDTLADISNYGYLARAILAEKREKEADLSSAP